MHFRRIPAIVMALELTVSCMHETPIPGIPEGRAMHTRFLTSIFT